MNYATERINFLESQKESINYEIKEMQEQEKKMNEKNGIEKWLGFTFESSSGLTEEFASFARDFKKEIKKICSDEFELTNFNRGHFYISGFVKRKSNGKYVYFSTSDVRFFKDSWYNSVLARTAQNDKDYTGGSNNNYSFNQLAEAFELLTN